MRHIAVVAAVLVLAAPSLAQDVPFLRGRVNDDAGILSEETRSRLERTLEDHERTTSNQLAVLTIPSLGGAVLEEYSIKVAETWALGQKGKDNGVLLLIARDDRKLRIEVGYGLEATLTDALCRVIIEREIVPAFRDGDYDRGVSAGVEAILGAIGGTYAWEETEAAEMGFWEIVLFVGFSWSIIGLFSIIAAFTKGASSWFTGTMMVPFWWGFSLPVAGATGSTIVVAVYIVLFLSAKRFLRSGTSRSGFVRSLESWAASAASSSGGGSSGGGFSGGGGSFGGGGSSGSW